MIIKFGAVAVLFLAILDFTAWAVGLQPPATSYLMETEAHHAP